VTGLIISHSHEHFLRNREYKERYTFAGGSFFELMKEKNLYSVRIGEIVSRVENLGLTGIFDK
jgi:hypothetical protein